MLQELYNPSLCIGLHLQFTIYEPMEHWEVDENTNVDVFEEIEENHPRLFKYAEAQVNVLDEPFVPFHIKTSIAKHVELQNLARTLMDHKNNNQKFM
jgi:hypothetical protein